MSEGARERERVREGETGRNRMRYGRQQAGVNSERDEDNPAMLVVVLARKLLSSATKRFSYAAVEAEPAVLCLQCVPCFFHHSIARAWQGT